jgi:hypothetical protein
VRVTEILRERARLRRAARGRRKDEISRLRGENQYRVALQGKLAELNAALDGDGVLSVEIDIPDKYLNFFLAAMNKEEMNVYKITPVSENRFNVARRVIILDES